MRKTLLVLTIAASAAGPAAASDKDDVMAVLKHSVAAINKGDVQEAAADCSEHASITDEFTPFSWQGPTACADWAKAIAALNARMEITDTVLTLGKPWSFEVTGDSAYAVIPTTLRFKEKGKPRGESGSVWTFALQKSAAGWKITAWTWSRGRTPPL